VSRKHRTDRYISALRLAAAGDPRSAGRTRPQQGSAPEAVADAAARALAALTAHEREVLRLVASGQSNAEIAARPGISDHTAKRHVANVLARLDLPTRGAAGRPARPDLTRPFNPGPETPASRRAGRRQHAPTRHAGRRRHAPTRHAGEGRHPRLSWQRFDYS